MTERILSSFRQGNLAEDQCLLALRRVAAVTKVERPEDIGIDLVCTLLRRDGTLLRAEDTFAVQCKSSSDRSLTFDTRQLRWLLSLEVPYLVASSDLKTMEISLYSTAHVGVAALARLALQVQGLELLLDPPEDRLGGQPWSPSEDLQGMQKCWLGPPVVSTSLPALVDLKEQERVYRTLKPWLQCATRCRRLWAYGIGLEVWPDDSGAPAIHSMLTVGHEYDLEALCEDLDSTLWRFADCFGPPGPGCTPHRQQIEQTRQLVQEYFELAKQGHFGPLSSRTTSLGRGPKDEG